MHNFCSLKPASEPACGNVADLIANYLEVEGVTTVFGVPGGPAMAMFAALAAKRSIRTVLCKTEQGALFAADGYARASRRLGVALVTSGPGATNALTGMATAWVDSVPLLVLSGQVATSAFGRGAAQDGSALGVDVVAMAGPVTALSCMLTSAAQAARVLPAALRIAWTRRKPVHLSLPADVLVQPVATRLMSQPMYRLERAAPCDRAAMDHAASLLAYAARPMLLLGSGARVAEPALWVSLAERLGAGVATSPKAKGVFPERHRLSMGVFGFAGSPRAEHALLSSDIDVLMVIGCSLGELASDNWTPHLRPATLIQCDVDPVRISATYPALPLVGDARAVAVGLLEQLSSHPHRPDQVEWLEELKRRVPRTLDANHRSSALQPSAKAVVEALQEALPKDALVVCDIGNSMAYALHHLCLRDSQDFMINLGFACMGHAVPAAIGARHACPDRPIVCLVGDAAFAMTGFEVHTAVEYPVRRSRCGGPVFIVMNNGGNGMVKAGVLAQYGADSGIDAGMYRIPFDIAAIARGLGLVAECVERPIGLAPALVRALHRDRGPTLIDVQVDAGDIPPLGKRIENLVAYAQPEGVMS